MLTMQPIQSTAATAAKISLLFFLVLLAVMLSRLRAFTSVFVYVYAICMTYVKRQKLSIKQHAKLVKLLFHSALNKN